MRQEHTRVRVTVHKVHAELTGSEHFLSELMDGSSIEVPLSHSLARFSSPIIPNAWPAGSVIMSRHMDAGTVQHRRPIFLLERESGWGRHVPGGLSDAQPYIRGPRSF